MTNPSSSALPSGFDPSDVGEIRITMGDADHNGRVDLRVRFFGKVPLLEKEPTQKMCLGPFNVPVEEALRVASQMAALVPAPAAPAVGMVLGAAAGAVGGVQRLMLLPRP